MTVQQSHRSTRSNMARNPIHCAGPWLQDQHGRTLMLRGVNLAGSSKIPTWPDIATEEDLYNHRNVSFVGRPLPLEKADEHFARLRRWGLTFLRFLITWEAIEHEGPGRYDEAYLEYISQVVRRAAAHGLHIYIDPHQDVWSRLSGGDGAPGWTFEAVGFDVTRFRAAGAANIHPFDEEPFVVHWLTNYTRLASATMFTLFFGGNDFAPRTTIGGEPAQEFLQRHYINAIKQVALRLQDVPEVVGFGTMNEPSSGFIGRRVYAQNDELHLRRLGLSPTPFQAMLLGAGYSQEVEHWGIGLRGLRSQGTVLLNQDEVRVWQEGRECLWRENGVWDVDAAGEPRLLRPHHFTHVVRGGNPARIDFGQDYLRPFVNRFAHELRSTKPDMLFFVENVPRLPMPRWGHEDAPNVVNASHWYDVQTLFLGVFISFLNLDIKTGGLVVGKHQVHRLFFDQLAAIKQDSLERMGGVPTLLGEFGTSFSMPFKLNFRLNWFGLQERALDASFRAIEENLLNATLWNYTPDNTNRQGDRWNTEDLSIFSRDQMHDPGDPDSGGRALAAVVRPYPRCTAGEPLSLDFDWQRHTFRYTFRHDPTVQMPTEIFVPSLHFANGCHIEVSDGTYELDKEAQILRYWHETDLDVHRITIWSVPAEKQTDRNRQRKQDDRGKQRRQAEQAEPIDLAPEKQIEARIEERKEHVSVEQE